MHLSITSACSHAALGDKGNLIVHAETTSIEGDLIKPYLCTLRANTMEQCNLSLVFGYDVPVRVS